MAESELGVAVLRVSVDSREALAGLEALRARFTNELGDLGSINFRGVERSAGDAGQRAGRALRNGLASATAGLRFDSIKDALDFSGALNGTLRDLRQYQTALVALREVTPATAEGFNRLNDVIAATGQAIRNFSSGTDALEASIGRVRRAASSPELQELSDYYGRLERNSTSAAEAQDTFATSTRRTTRAVAQSNGFIEQQISAYRTLAAVASKGSSDIASAARFGTGLAKGAIGLGKGIYSAGAEFGLFETPRVGPIKQTIADIQKRFEFLGKQAQTTRGKILRSFEGAGTLAGLVVLSKEVQALSGYLNELKAASAATSSSFNWLAGVTQSLDRFIPDDAGLLGFFTKLANIGATSAAGVTSAAETVIRAGSDLVTGPLEGINQLSQALGSLPPEAQAAALALAGLSLGFKPDSAVNGLNQILDGLDLVRTRSLEVQSDLGRLLAKELQSSGLTPEERDQKRRNAEFLRQRREALLKARDLEQRLLTAPLALPSSDQLQQRVAQSGQTQPVRLQPGDTNLVNGEAVRLAQEQLAADLDITKAKADQANQQAEVNGLLGIGKRLIESTVNVIAEQTSAYQEQTAQLREQLAIQQQRRGVEAQRSKEARTQLAADAQRAQEVRQFRIDRLQQKRGEDFDRRLAEAQLRRERKQEARRRRSDAGGSALIGGAFPLLFGQGLGASVGGGAGGALGGLLGGQFGFGLSLVGTALGGVVDTLTKQFGDLSKALQDPINSLDQFISQANLSSKAQEDYVKALIDSGQAAKARLAIENELGKTVDPGAATLTADANDSYARTLANVQERLGSILAGPASGFLSFLDGVLQRLGGAAGNQPKPLTGPKAISDARNSAGVNFGGYLAGGLLTLGGIAALATGAGAPIGVGLIGSGLTIGGLGAAGLANDKGRLGIADSQNVAAGERQRERALQRQLVVEQQVAKARIEGRTGLAEQLTLQSQIAGLNTQFRTDVSKINQLQAAGRITDKEAVQQQEQLVETLKIRRGELAANGRAAALSSERELKNARETLGVYGAQRQILEERQKIGAAERDKRDAQQAFDNAVQQGFSSVDLDVLRSGLETAANNYNRVLITGQENIRRLEQQRWAEGVAAANRIKSIQEQTVIEQARPDLTGTGVGALQSVAAFREARRQEQNAQAALRTSPGDEGLLNTALEASKAVELAASKTKSDLLEAYRAAKDSVQQISRSIEDSVTALAETRGSSDGVNKFIGPNQRAQRLAEANTALIGQADIVARTLGVKPTFVGDLEQRNKQISEFIRAGRNESRLTQDIGKQQEDLVRANNDLSVVTKGLSDINKAVADALSVNSTALSDLVAKDWAVYVNVPGGSASGDIIGAVNGAY